MTNPVDINERIDDLKSALSKKITLHMYIIVAVVIVAAAIGFKFG